MWVRESGGADVSWISPHKEHKKIILLGQCTGLERQENIWKRSVMRLL
jgi:hypothetical protein